MRTYMRAYPLVSFFGIAFAVTWGIATLIWWLTGLGWESLRSPSGRVLVLLQCAIWGPSFAGIVMTAITDGKTGLRELFRRLLRWRVGLRWYLTVLVGVPSVALCASLLAAMSTERVTLRQFDPSAWYLVLPLLPFILIGGPLGEEIGWRGFALPRLLDRWGALPGSFVLGSMWGLWHLPAFVVPGLGPLAVGGEYAFMPFVIFTIALSISMTWVYMGTQGSVLLAGVGCHAMFNLSRFTDGPVTTTLIWSQALCFLAAALAILAAPGVARLLSRTADRAA